MLAPPARWTISRRFLLRAAVSIVALTALTVSTPARAADLDSGGSPIPLEVHGFVSQGFIRSTGNDYLVSDSEGGSFNFNEVGINFSSQLTDRFRVGIQLFAYDLGTLGNYTVNADWYSMDYRLRDWFGIRVGRLKMPLGLYNDVSDIDAARTPILLPASLYPATNRDFFLAQTGAEIYGYLSSQRMGALEYRLFGGSVAINLPTQLALQVPDLTIPYVAGGRLMWETPLEGLRIGVTGLVLKADITVIPPAPGVEYTEKQIIYSGYASIEYAAHDLLLQAEGVQERRETTITSTPSPTTAIVSEGGYGLAAYRVTRWLQPGLYYSFYYANRNLGSQINGTTNGENIQDDLAATLRFDINAFWLIKLEGHYMHGTALAADAAGSLATSPENWALFLIKTTAYF
jgi:hypothetical protein